MKTYIVHIICGNNKVIEYCGYSTLAVAVISQAKRICKPLIQQNDGIKNILCQMEG